MYQLIYLVLLCTQPWLTSQFFHMVSATPLRCLATDYFRSFFNLRPSTSSKLLYLILQLLISSNHIRSRKNYAAECYVLSQYRIARTWIIHMKKLCSFPILHCVEIRAVISVEYSIHGWVQHSLFASLGSVFQGPYYSLRIDIPFFNKFEPVG